MSTDNPLDHLRIASPCPSSWEKMAGDDRVRSCELCNLQVYNIASLTRQEVEAIIAKTQGRLCARLYRRADGTIITKDCPVGLRAVRQRAGKIAAALFAAITSLSASVLGQKPAPKDKSSCTAQVTVNRTTPDTSRDAGSISGTIRDTSGVNIPGVKIKVAPKDKSTVTQSETDAQGFFQVRGLKAGTYELSFEAKGFTSLKIVEIKLTDQDSVSVSAILVFKNVEVLIGIVGYESPLDTPMGTTIFSGDLIRRLPIPE
jgi:hypothetical protein